MSDPLTDSYAFCRKFARRTAKNFYYSFLGLPADRFDAMCVLYSYMRICDDIGDDEQQPVELRRAGLAAWNSAVRQALKEPPAPGDEEPTEPPTLDTLANGHRVLPALTQMVATFQIPHEYLFEVLAGVQADLEADQHNNDQLETEPQCCFATFDELAAYCYRVAGVVGRCCIHIWGFNDPRALNLAVDCGLAFQLTNILRDLAEDADNGRVYLPADELQRFDYSPQDILRRTRDERFQKLMAFQVERAAGYYDRANELFGYLDPVGQPILAGMIRIYGGLLTEIQKRQFDVYSQRVSLPTWRKLLIAADAILRRRRIPPRPIPRKTSESNQ